MILIVIVLIFYGFVFIWVEKCNVYFKLQVIELVSMFYKIVFLIGCFQVFSIVLGISCFGVIILGVIIIGISCLVVVDFIFFFVILIMFGYSGFKVVKYFLDGNVLSLD